MPGAAEEVAPVVVEDDVEAEEAVEEAEEVAVTPLCLRR